MALLLAYRWPGNVRELRNLVERSLILGEINVSALYPPLHSKSLAPEEAIDLETLQRRHIQAVLDSVGGDKTRAAQAIGHRLSPAGGGAATAVIGAVGLDGFCL